MRLSRGEEGLAPFLAQIRRLEPLTRQDELSLALRYQGGDEGAGQKLVTANLPAVVRIAQGYRGYRLSLADLVGEGCIGLLEAMKRFEPDRDLRFFTYARHWVRAYVLAFVLKQWSIVDMGTSAQQSKLFFRLQAEYGRLASQLGDSDESIFERLAQRFGVSEARVRFALARLGHRDASLDAPLRGEGETKFIDMLSDESPSQAQRAQNEQSNELVQRAVSQVWPRLSARQQRIVRERLLAGDDGKSLAELGRSMGITRERVRQIEASIKSVLRDELVALDAQPSAA